MEKLAPIVLFVYSRPEHTRQTIEALIQNTLACKSMLIIYSDAARDEIDKQKVDKVREYIQSIKGFYKVEIVNREKNFGLASNIIDGVTKIVNQFGRVIVLEDDLITAPYFLQFMNDALDTYKDEDRVGHIHACQFFTNDALPDIFFTKFVGSWGWATWDRAWKKFNPDGVTLLNELEKRHLTKEFDFDNAYGFTKMLRRQIKGLNNSWAIRWSASHFLNGYYALNAGKTMVQNIGMDGSGTNCGSGVKVTSDLYDKPLQVIKADFISENVVARQIIEKYYTKTYSFKAKAFRRIKRTLKGDFGT
jgi:hypothetical protein